MKSRMRSGIWVGTVILILIFCLIPNHNVYAASLTASGTCGTNVMWYLYDDGNMVIQGDGGISNSNYPKGTGFFEKPLVSQAWESYRSKIKYISIGKGVTSIGSYAFYGCENLIDVWIPSTVTFIGEYAFQNCSNLKQIIVPDNVTYLGTGVFSKCSSLVDVYIPNQITAADNLFEYCTMLEHIAIPRSWTKISSHMFYECTSLTTVEYCDEQITTIEDCAFYGCEKLEGSPFFFSKNIKSIGNYAFYNCKIFTMTPTASESIGNYAFYGCQKKENASIISLTVGEYAYANCPSLVSATISASVASIPVNCFRGDEALKEVTIYGESTTIGENAFTNCSAELVVSINQDNVVAIKYCDDNNINYKEVDYSASNILGGIEPLNTRRTLNTNHCFFYGEECCQVTRVEATGDIKFPLLGRDNSIHYSNDTPINSSNYTSFGTTPIAGSKFGVTKTYYYGPYEGSGMMLCCVAKTVPTVNMDSLTFSEGESRNLNVSSPEFPNYSYSSENRNVATVSSNGTVTAFKEGTSVIRIYAEPTENYIATVMEVTVTVKKNSEIPTDSEQTNGQSNMQPVQVITASSKTVAYKSKPFYLKVKSNAGGKLTYKSSDTNVVSISNVGKVTVKNYGSALITIKAAATGDYPAAQKKITITVVPRKINFYYLKSTKKKCIVAKWKADKTVTGYQMQISTSKTFKQETFQRTFKKSKTSMQTGGLKSKKTYYVRIRAYKTVGKKKCYGTWSTVRKVKIK